MFYNETAILTSDEVVRIEPTMWLCDTGSIGVAEVEWDHKGCHIAAKTCNCRDYALNTAERVGHVAVSLRRDEARQWRLPNYLPVTVLKAGRTSGPLKR